MRHEKLLVVLNCKLAGRVEVKDVKDTLMPINLSRLELKLGPLEALSIRHVSLNTILYMGSLLLVHVLSFLIYFDQYFLYKKKIMMNQEPGCFLNFWWAGCDFQIFSALSRKYTHE